MSYKKYYEGGWRSGETGGTPITPEALNHMEQGISDAAPMEYAKKVAAPHNLFDNSDWSDLVNQRGKTEYTTSAYAFDRWFIVGNLKATVSNGGVILANNTESTHRIVQKIPMDRFTEGKTYTLAVRTKNGNIFCGSAVLGTTSTTILASTEFYAQFLISTSDNTMMFELRQRAGYTTEYVNLALYEGEYTAKTLPEYQPKGYAAELAECHRYFRRYHAEEYGSLGNGTARNSTTVVLFLDLGDMRVWPTLSFTGKVMALGGSTHNGLTISTDTFVNGIMRLNVSGTNFEAGKSYIVAAEAGGAIVDFSADL